MKSVDQYLWLWIIVWTLFVIIVYTKCSLEMHPSKIIKLKKIFCTMIRLCVGVCQNVNTPYIDKYFNLSLLIERTRIQSTSHSLPCWWYTPIVKLVLEVVADLLSLKIDDFLRMNYELFKELNFFQMKIFSAWLAKC